MWKKNCNNCLFLHSVVSLTRCDECKYRYLCSLTRRVFFNEKCMCGFWVDVRRNNFFAILHNNDSRHSSLAVNLTFVELLPSFCEWKKSKVNMLWCDARCNTEQFKHWWKWVVTFKGIKRCKYGGERTAKNKTGKENVVHYATHQPMHAIVWPRSPYLNLKMVQWLIS